METHLIELIIKKLGRQKPVDTIADEVEQELSYVQAVCQIIEEHPDAEAARVYALIKIEYSFWLKNMNKTAIRLSF